MDGGGRCSTSSESGSTRSITSWACRGSRYRARSCGCPPSRGRAAARLATALVALSRWGCRCKYVGNVGDDEHGRLSSLLLSREGVDLAHVRTVARRLVPIRGDPRGGKDGGADHPVGPGSADPGIAGRPAAGRYPPGAGAPSRRSRRPPGDCRGEGPPGPRASPSSSMRKRCRRERRNCCPCATTSWPRDTSRAC